MLRRWNNRSTGWNATGYREELVLDDTIESLDGGGRQVIRREGEYWMIVYAGETCRLKDTNGLRYLAALLRRPYERVAATEIELSAHGNAPPLAAVGEPDGAARERARVNVTRALSRARKRIAAHHPVLERHLEATLRTGASCTYSPDPRVPTVWEQ